MPNIAIFASGAGSNARQIIRFFSDSNHGVHVKLIITNKATAGVVEVAKNANVDVLVLKNEVFIEGSELVKMLRKHQINWIVLAGFLRKIPLDLIRVYTDRIINLHPSLLPKYGGKGMYGKFVHDAVILNNEKESGITIHLVNEEYDTGEILFQESCLIEKGDTIEDLTKKIHDLEHKYFPQVIKDQILKRK